MFRLWFERAIPPGVERLLEGRAEAVAPGPSPDPLATAADADGAIASAGVTYDAAAFDRAPRLRVVSRTGIGVDKIDLEEATRRGIAVCNAPDAPTISTAEHTMALLLAVAKRLEESQERLRSAEGDYFSRQHGLELNGATLGVIGFGRIGRRVAALARSFGMRVLVFDPMVTVDPSEGETASTLAELLSSADAVSLHLPLLPATRHLIDEQAISVMRPGALLVNAARGGLIDHRALLDALESGRLGGAGLDVTEPEPLPPDHPLLQRSDVIVTPHIAAATGAGKKRLYAVAVHQALEVLEGRRPQHLVNPGVFPSEDRPRGEGD